MKYIIVGHGRTGTHWVQDLISSCFKGSWETVESLEGLLVSETDDVILHTNDSDLVIDRLYAHLYETCRIVYCYRQGTVAIFTSLAVAKVTNEWGYYTAEPVEPFKMDVDEFIDNIKNYYVYHRYTITELRRVFPPDRLSVVCYEDLFRALDRRQYICEKLSLEYIPINEQVLDEQFRRGRNPRRYREIITNYSEIEQASENLMKQLLPPWVDDNYR